MKSSVVLRGGGGSALDSLFPGYKDKIWMNLTEKTRSTLVRRANDKFEAELKSVCVSQNSRMKMFFKMVAEPLAPSYRHRLPTVDYKRQIARGTFLVGRRWYQPDGKNRLSNDSREVIMEPFTEQEQRERHQHRRFPGGQLLLTCAAAAFLIEYYATPKTVKCVMLPPEPPKYPWWFMSPLHSHDIAGIRRGYEVYRQVCATCHAQEYMSFRFLVNEVYPEKRVLQIAASYDVEDGPNDQGDMFTRPGQVNDNYPNPYPNDEAARYANGGAKPVEMTVVSCAHEAGPNYIFQLVTSYKDPPEGLTLRPGLYYNPYFIGGIIGMPPPLTEGLVEYEDGTPATVSQMGKDVTSYIVWSAERCHNERKLTGLTVCSGLCFTSLAMTLWYRLLWTPLRTRKIHFNKIAI